MKAILLIYILPALTVAGICLLLSQLLLKYSVRLKLVDVPNERKLHKQPVPVAGGIMMGLSIAIAGVCFSSLRTLVMQYPFFFIATVVIMALGVADDFRNIPAKFRLLTEIACAYLVADHGIRITSLHGIFGITELPIALQYILTVVIITGLTNAFNLMDGIDGLAGSFSLINMGLLAVGAIICNQHVWLPLIVAVMAALVVFLRFNWKPAKMFMGDGGSLVLGFITANLGILFIEQSATLANHSRVVWMLLIITACIIPVTDTLRVFFIRMRNGKSPFSADKNHLHHWLIRHHLSHSQATLRIIALHIILLLFAVTTAAFLSISAVVVITTAFVWGYTRMLQLNNLFYKWYRHVKRMETAA